MQVPFQAAIAFQLKGQQMCHLRSGMSSLVLLLKLVMSAGLPRLEPFCPVHPGAPPLPSPHISRQFAACALRPWYFCLGLESILERAVWWPGTAKWVSSCSSVTSSQKVFQNVDVVSRVIFQASKRKPTSTVTIELRADGPAQHNWACFSSKESLRAALKLASFIDLKGDVIFVLADHIVAVTDGANREKKVWPPSSFDCGRKFDGRGSRKMES